jgi:hypothetical protein
MPSSEGVLLLLLPRNGKEKKNIFREEKFPMVNLLSNKIVRGRESEREREMREKEKKFSMSD